jgi:D-beta-D-heptose 7-phosphate kinase/D-beta-D-heptose 1-phosphate adenosyltransferase
MADFLQDNMQSLVQEIEGLDQAKVLCIGDLMLDRFIYGAVHRVSPEAPIPVVAIEEETSMLGGAGNVARNLLALGSEVCFLSVVGGDTIGKELTAMIGKEARMMPYVLVEKGRVSTRKTRYIAGNQQLLRADEETQSIIRDDTQKNIIKILEDEIANYDVIIVSDYNKGLLTEAIIKTAIDTANAQGKCMIVDPKIRDFSVYTGADIISPNLHELAEATGMPLGSDEEVIAAAQHLIEQYYFGYVLVTRSKDGMSLISKEGDAMHIPAQAREVYDVSGAGDTTIATLAAALSVDISVDKAAFLSNLAAGVAVGKVGTAVVYRTDLKTALYTYDAVSGSTKILPFDLAQAHITRWQQEGYKVGFTNGCFDVVHSGHIALLEDARQTCDKLVVGLNSDSSVKRLKGEERPINNEMDRATLLAALSVVDMVVIFREDTPMNLIEAFKPDRLIKGADYKKEEVVGYERVESYGGEILLVPLREGKSTTAIINKIRA